MIHQGFNLVPRATVARNVIAGALPAISTVRALIGFYPVRHQQKACALIAEVGLGPEHLTRRVSTLSGGQQQRVGIARAFMLDPAVVLADEPVASLDPQINADVLDLIQHQARACSATVLCSLHQIDLALRFADRIVALRAGRIALDATPSQLNADCLKAFYGDKPARSVTPAPERCGVLG